MDGSLILQTYDYPVLAFPLCGGTLYEFRQKLKCSSRSCPYQETCCEGGPCDQEEGESK